MVEYLYARLPLNFVGGIYIVVEYMPKFCKTTLCHGLGHDQNRKPMNIKTSAFCNKKNTDIV